MMHKTPVVPCSFCRFARILQTCWKRNGYRQGVSRHFPARPQDLRRQPYHTLHMQAFHTTLLPVSGKFQVFATFPFPSSFCFIEKTNMIIQYKIYAIQASGIRKACMHPSTYLCACGRWLHSIAFRAMHQKKLLHIRTTASPIFCNRIFFISFQLLRFQSL